VRTQRAHRAFPAPLPDGVVRRRVRASGARRRHRVPDAQLVAVLRAFVVYKSDCTARFRAVSLDLRAHGMDDAGMRGIDAARAVNTKPAARSLQ